jgi:sulfotransferase
VERAYYFLSGLPRSGNTLLSALLNQNPDIYSSPLSPLPELFYQLNMVETENENTKRNIENKIRVNNLSNNLIGTFYKDVNKPIIIDRNKTWGSPAHLELIKTHITPKPKIIFTVRSILDILASFVNLSPKSYTDDYFSGKYFMNYYRNDADGFAEYLMRINGNIDYSLCCLANAFRKENDGVFHIVEYDDLVTNTQTTMDKIYKFLDTPNYTHDFTNINKIENDIDEPLGFPKNMHEVKKEITVSQTNAKEVLSPYIYHKYSGMDFWREGSLLKMRGEQE